MEAKDPGTGNQGSVDFKIGVFRGGAYENDQTFLDGRQESILLAFIESMDLVDEEDGAFPIEPQIFPGLFQDLPNILDPGDYCIELDKVGFGGVGNDPGQGGFPRARRSIK